jgi:hypothetical protein
MRKKILYAVLLFISASLFNLSCQKETQQPTVQKEPAEEETLAARGNQHLKQTKDYSSEVVLKWMDMQLRLIRTNATPLGGLQPGRYFAYCGIAAYESVLPGMPAYRTLS